ncbi:unnamed protein product [Penicillium salamii]|nr:unnamed protein product [Penicillium salamii]CAG8376330.1 unnamed protein product [Penicillium salamii]
MALLVLWRRRTLCLGRWSGSGYLSSPTGSSYHELANNYHWLGHASNPGARVDSFSAFVN